MEADDRFEGLTEIEDLTWFSSGNTNNLLGTPRVCNTLKAANPSEIGKR